jgi:VWFA-related protein
VAGHRLDHLRAAARAFVDGLGPQDQATLLTFSHAVRLASAPSLDRAPLRRALDEARAGGGTALHDALFAALQFADPSLGRGVVLVFSDGDDRLSWLDARQLRDAVRRSEASIYAVALTSAADAGGSGSVAYLPDTSRGQGRTVAPGRHGDAPNRELLPSNVFRPASASPRTELPPLLRDLAVDTGGRVWQAEGGPQLQAAFLQALAEAKSRYLLRFAPSAAPGWHSLEVRLRARKGEVRARKGYVAAAP